MTMLLKRVLGRKVLLGLLLVAGLALGAVGIGPLGSGPLAPGVVAAHSVCDQHYSHTHGWVWPWISTDYFYADGDAVGPQGYETHWTEHKNNKSKNIAKDWCDS